MVLVYAASGPGDLLKACFAPKKDRDTIIFVRHRTGTTYYWYEALSTKYLQTGRPEPGRNSCLDHGPVHVDDVVVDSTMNCSGGCGPSMASRTSSAPVSSPWAAPGVNTRPRPHRSPARNTGSTSSTSRTTRSPRTSRQQGKPRHNRRRPALDRGVSRPAPHDPLHTKEFVTNAFVLYGLFKDLMPSMMLRPSRSATA